MIVNGAENDAPNPLKGGFRKTQMILFNQLGICGNDYRIISTSFFASLIFAPLKLRALNLLNRNYVVERSVATKV